MSYCVIAKNLDGCNHLIHNTSQCVVLFVIIIEFFDEPCKFDYLLVRDKEHNNDVLGKFCGTTIPGPIVSKSNSLWVTMITDGQDNKAGFRASWEIQEQEPEGE